MNNSTKEKNAHVGAQVRSQKPVHQKRAKEIGLRIKKVRGNVNQTEFAKMLGVHRSTLSRYERGEFEPNVDFLERICSIFGIDINWLLFGKEPMYRDEKEKSCRESEKEKSHPKMVAVGAGINLIDGENNKVGDFFIGTAENKKSDEKEDIIQKSIDSKVQEIIELLLEGYYTPRLIDEIYKKIKKIREAMDE